MSASEPKKCGCHKCNEGVMVYGFPYAATTMIVCDVCGNKRCPHANNHQNSCTGSNSPGQLGSAYANAWQPTPKEST